MSGVREIHDRILRDGEDGVIDAADVALIKSVLPADGTIPADDLKALADMRSEAHSVVPEFDVLFFTAFKAAILADGTVDFAEQYKILHVIYGDGIIDRTERGFLNDLRAALKKKGKVPPEFEALYTQAMREPSR